MENLIKEDRFFEILKKFKEIQPLMVVGDIGIDKYTFGEVTRISPEAPVPVLEVKKEWLKLAMAANISHNLKTMNVDSLLFGVVGEDLYATQMENLLEEEGLRTWGVVRSPEWPTILKERVTTNSQQICRIDYESKEKIPQTVEDHLLERIHEFESEHGALIIEDYSKGTLSGELVQALIKSARKNNKTVAVDPGRGADALKYKGATLLKPNFVESQYLARQFGENGDDLETIANCLMEKLELEKLIITLGSKGMAIKDMTVDNGKLDIIPTVANEVFDVSGAGDTAMSAIVSALEAGACLREAAWVGNCASGIVVGKRGTATVTTDELTEFYKTMAKKLAQ
jgi:D-glycero-beta-D-manno-heptose-7-phosphate kinase